jgi:hypothetical protein
MQELFPTTSFLDRDVRISELCEKPGRNGKRFGENLRINESTSYLLCGSYSSRRSATPVPKPINEKGEAGVRVDSYQDGNFLNRRRLI